MNKNIGLVQNLKYVQLKVFERQRFLMSGHDKTGFKNSLFLDGKNEFIKVNKKIEENFLQVLNFSFFIGFLTYQHKQFFLFAEYVKFIAKIKKCTIYEVVNIQPIAIEADTDQNLLYDLKKFLNFFSKGFYFSYDPLERFFCSGIDSNKNFSINNDLTTLLQQNEMLREWYLPLYQGFLGSRQLIFDQAKLVYHIFARYGFKNSNLIEITSILEIEGKEELWYYNTFLTTNLYNNLVEQMQNFLQNNKILVVNTLNKYDNGIYNSIQQFQNIYEQISKDSKNFKYQYLRYRDKDLQTFKQQNKYYHCWEIYRQMITYYKDNDYLQNTNQALYFMIQTQDGINKTALLGVMEILFEALKIRLKELDLIQERKSKPMNFKQFYENMMFNFAAFIDDFYKNLQLNFHFETEQKNDQELFQNIENNKKQYRNIIQNSCFFYQSKPKDLQSLNKQIQFREKILEEKDMKFLILTYNVAGLNPLDNKEKFEKFFSFINQFDVDMIVLGFQELMEMKITFKNLKKMMNSQNLIDSWLKIFHTEIPKYRIIFQYNLLGLQTFVIVNKKTQTKFQVIDVDESKLGVMKMANKGAISLLIKAEDTLLEFTNCHLAAGYGYEAIENRSKHLQSIISQKDNYIFVGDVEYSFISGDTNFKILRDRHDFMEEYTRKRNCFDKFQNFDEFKYNIKHLDNFKKYKEEFPNFPPTFKYIKQSQHFHESKTPAWTDRIFYSCKSNKIKINQYKTYPIILSDHLPVFLDGQLKIQKKEFLKINPQTQLTLLKKHLIINIKYLKLKLKNFRYSF